MPLLLVLPRFRWAAVQPGRDLEVRAAGEDTATALRVRVARTRIVIIVAAVGMIASATSITGPIAFVSFLAGPIAARIVGGSGSLLLPSALIGAALTLAADYTGQFLLPSRYPVGVVTGALGAPYLLSPHRAHQPERKVAMTDRPRHVLEVRQLSAGYGET